MRCEKLVSKTITPLALLFYGRRSSGVLAYSFSPSSSSSSSSSLSSAFPTKRTHNNVKHNFDHNHHHHHHYNDRNMLLRIRSNLGTWKLQYNNDDNNPNKKLLSVNDVLSNQKFEGFTIVQPLSKDPGGTSVLSNTESLQEQGIGHGSMIYCRLEPMPSPLQKTNESWKADEKDPAASDGSHSISAHQDVISVPDDNEDEEENTTVVVANKNIPSSKKPYIVEILDSDSGESVNLLASSSEEEEDAGDKKRPSRKKRQGEETTGPIANNPYTQKRPKTAAATSSASPSPASKPDNFQIASYNIWFGPPDPEAKQVFPQQRMKAIARILQETSISSSSSGSSSSSTPLLFIGFQELTDSLRQYLMPELQSMGYRMCTQPLGASYGVGLAIPSDTNIVDSKFVPFRDSIQGRGLLYVQTPTVLFGTMHLESFVDAQRYNGVEQRELQIVEATKFCQSKMQQHSSLQMAILAGDFNWDDERKRGNAPNRPLLSLISDQWNDAGTPFDYTYDCKENCMLGGNLRRRFDRCLYLTRNDSKNPYEHSFQKIGNTKLPNLTWNKKNPYNGTSRPVPVAPSDHFGIAVRFSSKK